MQETQVQSPSQEDPLEKEIATHSSTLAWKILRMEEPGRQAYSSWGHKESDTTERLHRKYSISQKAVMTNTIKTMFSR